MRVLAAAVLLLCVACAHHVDREAFPPELEPIAPALPPDAGIPETPDPNAPPPVIDVLVLYTPASRQADETDGDLQAFTAATIANANAAFVNSGNAVRLRQAGPAMVVTYDEGMPAATNFWDATLRRLHAPDDGVMDDVHALRDAHRADVVVLLVRGDARACGFSFMMQNVSSAFAPWAFSVVRRDCASGNHSFVHEIGHILGCCHDRTVDPNCRGAFPDSYAFRIPNRFRTVMAYACAPEEPCPRVPFFSNPNVTFRGTPTGVSGSEHNARTIDQTAATVAGFRP